MAAAYGPPTTPDEARAFGSRCRRPCRTNSMTASADRVFLVDDDPAVLTALGRLLRAAGLEVLGFSSAEAFLRMHDTVSPGCAVLDIALPDVNGIEIQRRLGELGCERPIIFLTGQGTIPMSVEAMKAGAVD